MNTLHGGLRLNKCGNVCSANTPITTSLHTGLEDNNSTVNSTPPQTSHTVNSLQDPDSPAGMHFSVRPTMHEILSQRRLDYAAFSNGFQAKMPPFQDKTPFLQAKSPVTTPTSNLQAELLPASAPPNY